MPVVLPIRQPSSLGMASEDGGGASDPGESSSVSMASGDRTPRWTWLDGQLEDMERMDSRIVAMVDDVGNELEYEQFHADFHYMCAQWQEMARPLLDWLRASVAGQDVGQPPSAHLICRQYFEGIEERYLSWVRYRPLRVASVDLVGQRSASVEVVSSGEASPVSVASSPRPAND